MKYSITSVILIKWSARMSLKIWTWFPCAKCLLQKFKINVIQMRKRYSFKSNLSLNREHHLSGLEPVVHQMSLGNFLPKNKHRKISSRKKHFTVKPVLYKNIVRTSCCEFIKTKHSLVVLSNLQTNHQLLLIILSNDLYPIKTK